MRQLIDTHQSIFILDIKHSKIDEIVENKLIPASLSHHTTTLMNDEIWIIGGLVRYSVGEYYHNGRRFQRGNKVFKPRIVVLNVNSKELLDLTDEIETDDGE